MSIVLIYLGLCWYLYFGSALLQVHSCILPAVSLPQQTGFSFMAAIPSDQTPPPENDLIITVACLFPIHNYKNLLQIENF